MCSPIGHNNTKHFLCPIRSRHPLEFLEMVRWESVPRGSFARNENFRPAFSPDPTDCPWVSADAPKLARNCGIEHWLPCGADGRAAGGRADGRCTVTWLPNFPGWVDLPAHGAAQTRFARQSSASNRICPFLPSLSSKVFVRRRAWRALFCWWIAFIGALFLNWNFHQILILQQHKTSKKIEINISIR